MKLQVKKASTDVKLIVFVQDSSSTTGAGLTGLAYDTASLACYYVRPGSAAAQLTLATQTVTGAHSDGGFVEIDATNMPGIYRLDVSDAVVATGVDSVVVMLQGAADMAPLPLEIELIAYDPQDSVRQGMTALPNAAADGAGGLIISDAGGLDADAASGITLSGTASAGSTTTITLAGGVATDNYYAGQLVKLNAGTGVGQSRTILSYAGATAIATVTRDWALAPDNTSKFSVHGDDVPAILEAGTAQAGGVATITLDANASAISDTYKNNFVMITAGTGLGQTRLIGAYNGGTKVATIIPNWTTNPDSTSVYQILPAARVDVGGWAGAVATLSAGNKPDVNVTEMDAGVVTAAAIADAAIDNATFAADVGSTAYATNIIALAVRKALDELNLDHLCKTATAAADMTAEVVDNSILSRVLGNGDTSAFDPSTDGLQLLRDRGDSAWITATGFATAAVCTEARLAELDAANLPTDIANLNDIAAADVWAVADGIETGFTPKQATQVIAAACMGIVSGAGSATEVFKGLDKSTTRGTITVDEDGNRSAITYNV